VLKRKVDDSFWTVNTFLAGRILNKNIRDLYGVPQKKKLEALANTVDSLDKIFTKRNLFVKSYPSRNRFENFDKQYGLYLDYPNSRLYLNYHAALGFFGVISIHSVGMDMHRFKLNPLVIINGSGTISGFNNTFLDYFQFQNPGKALYRRNASRLMEPNPVDAITGNTTEFRNLPNEKWTPAWKMDLERIKAQDLAAFMTLEDTQKTARGVKWSSKVDKQALIQIKRPLNTRENDIKVEIDVTVHEGEFPSVILNGDRDFSDFFPDFSGYLVGPRPGMKCFQLKKQGTVIHIGKSDLTWAKGRRRVVLIKRGSAIALFIDGRFILGYRDPGIINRPEGYLYLYCRTRSDITFHAMTVETLPAAGNLHAGFNKVFLRIEEENGFEFFHLNHDFIMPDEDEIYYFIVLYNITRYKQNIDLLQKAQKQIVHERDRYKAMALKGGLEDSDFVGRSPALVNIKRDVKKAAASFVTVLIEGETGTGKEVLAKHIHRNSPQRKGPFIKLDCSALPETLIESELFGVEKGAFTGATESRIGKLEAADGGTLFLDELANLDLKTQAKLLNFLQDFELARLGSTKTVKVSTRIIAASNKGLKELVDRQAFRADLYFRLSVARFQLPPLRERMEDITFLCRHFLEEYNLKLNKAVKGFTPAGHRKLLGHHWPGNVRELENIVQNAVLFCEEDLIDERHVNIPVTTGPSEAPEPETDIPIGDARALRPEHVRELLKRNNNIAVRAAKEAKVSLSSFYRKSKRTVCPALTRAVSLPRMSMILISPCFDAVRMQRLPPCQGLGDTLMPASRSG
jgi:DNA-binding NtrC family response regulator